LNATELHTTVEDRSEEVVFAQFEDVLINLFRTLDECCGEIRLALLLDEVEITAHLPWVEEFFNHLRALVYDGSLSNNIKLVLTGSARVVKVHEAGSPLLNMVNVTYLRPLSRADIQTLIEHGGTVSSEVSELIQSYSGGHPFIAKFILYHLWDEGFDTATPDQFTFISRLMRRERTADFSGWWEAIGANGRRTYIELIKSGDWRSEKDIIAAHSSDETEIHDSGLDTLCYHGLVECDETQQRYRIGSRLFFEWVSDRVDIPRRESVGSEETPSDPQIITWLHLSDLHFKEDASYDENIVLQALLNDIAQRIVNDNLRPDFIVITGDLAYAGKKSEYDLATQFLNDLLSVTDVPRERLFVIPGNHDVDRTLITQGTTILTTGLTSRADVNAVLVDGDQRRTLIARFKEYSHFFNTYFNEYRIFDSDNLFYVAPFEANGRKIAIIGLNSALVSSSNEDRSRLILGERLIRTAIDEARKSTAEILIAILHHPFYWLQEFEQGDSATLLMDNCSFILHGHLHELTAASVETPDSSATVIAGGACYDTREYPNAYNFVQLDLDAKQGSIHMRAYSDKHGGFWAKATLLYKNVPDGVYKFSLPERLFKT
jgi:predicted MPP superfamily phosphohydrolase